MTFRLPTGRSGNRQRRLYTEDDLLWGVPRRSGYDQQDDPKAHAGQMQHAFEPGNDERAICGFESPKRASGATQKPKPQLAVPTARLNPRCPKCVRLISVPVQEQTEGAGPTAVADEQHAEAEATAGHDTATDPETPAEAEDSPEPELAAEPDMPAAPEPLAEPDMAAEPELGGEPETPAEPERTLEADLEAVGPELAPAPEPSRQPELEASESRRQSAEPPIVAPPAAWDSAQQPSILRRLSVPPPPAPPPARRDDQTAQRIHTAVTPPELRSHTDSWEGTVKFAVGQISTVVRPPEQAGLGVVASVVAGPSGTRVASVTMNADGTALISLSDPARAVVTVAWFVVPVVDNGP
jgi:hypothetical protein